MVDIKVIITKGASKGLKPVKQFTKKCKNVILPTRHHSCDLDQGG